MRRQSPASKGRGARIPDPLRGCARATNSHAMRPLLFALLLGAPIAAFQRQTDVDRLQGTWRVSDARARMSNEPAMIIDGMVDVGTIEFAGNKVIMRQLGNADLETYEFTLDTSASPRRIRLIDISVA